MSKKILIPALLATAVSATWSQSSVTLYGITDAAIRHTTNEQAAGQPEASKTQLIGGGMSESRLGVNIVEDLGGGMKALANIEHRLLLDSGNSAVSNFWQQSWVGLQSSSYGRVTLGRQYNILFDLVTTTYASYPNSPYFEAYKPELGFALGARASNMVKYMFESGPVRGGIQVSAGEGAATGGRTNGFYLRYAANGVAVGLGYNDYEFASGKKIKVKTVGGSYKTGPWYLNAGWANNKVDDGLTPIDLAVLSSVWTANTSGGFGGPAFLAANERDVYTVGFGYQFTPAWNLGAHYFHAKQDGRNASAHATAKFVTAALDYAFSKRTDAYLEVDRTTLDGNVSLNSSTTGTPNGSKERTGLTVGVRHRF